MKLFARLRPWWPARLRLRSLLAAGSSAWLLSLTAHAGILTGLAMMMVSHQPSPQKLIAVVSEAEPPPEDPLTNSDEFTFSDEPRNSVGSTSAGDGQSDFSVAPNLGLDATPATLDLPVAETGTVVEPIQLQEEIQLATSPNFAENLTVMGAAGVGAVGTDGAVDRLTQEILLRLEQRPTLVVWLFDQSGSLERQRGEIIKRFDRIYEELGVIEARGNPAFARHEDKPLLSSVVSFGENITFLTPKPTDDVNEIKDAVRSIKTDPSGIERTFQAVAQSIERYRPLRTQSPRRNIMVVIFSDEVGDDEVELDRTVSIARRLEIPVFCVGVPAPFGMAESSIKYVDPDPKYDQSPQWIKVRQGPESMLPELVKIGDENEEPMDSGFGPYCLTRLCYETGGIFFAVHPNRREGRKVGRGETAVLSAQLSHFFQPDLMLSYRPDYLPRKEYERLLRENEARRALVDAARFSWVTPMQQPTLEFPVVSEADFAGRLQRAAQAAAVLDPKIVQLHETLRQGERDRPNLTTPRWQAGYDLSMGRVLALKVRTQGYNHMMAKAKNGMQFKSAKHDTWRLVPTGEVKVTSALEKEAEQARQYLQRVIDEHPGTPWALVARKELDTPLGWKWEESYTGVNAPPQVAQNNNAPPRTPQDERAQMIKRPERRPPPKL